MNAPVARVDGSLRKRARARVKAVRMPIIPSLERRRMQCYLAFMLGDIAALFLGFAAAYWIYPGTAAPRDEFALAQLLLPVYLTLALSNDAYAIAALRRASCSLGGALGALALSSAIVTFITFYTKSSAQFSRLGFTLGVVIVAVFLALGRLAMRRLVHWRCGANVVNELVIDDGGPAVNLPGAFHVSAQGFGLVPSLNDPYAMDRIGMALRNADLVVVSSTPERRALWAVILKGANVCGEVIDDSVGELCVRGARMVEGQALLQVSVGPLGMRARVMKRLFDVGWRWWPCCCSLRCC